MYRGNILIRRETDVPGKVHIIQLVNTLPEKGLPAPSGNIASRQVTVCSETNGVGYRTVTQVKGLNPEITIMPTDDIVQSTKGGDFVTANQWQGNECPTGYETMVRYQMDILGIREAQSVPPIGVCAIKPTCGKVVQTILWALRMFLIRLFKSLTGQLIVSLKRDNACGGKGLAVEPLGQGHIHPTEWWVKDGNKMELTTYQENDRKVPLKSGMRENLKSCSVRGSQ